MWNFVCRNLHTQIASGYHHAIGCFDDLINIMYTFRIFNLGNHIDPLSAVCAKQFFDLFDRLCISYERSGDKVDALLDTKQNIVLILFGDCREFYFYIRNIDSFFLTQFSAIDNPTDYIGICYVLNSQLNQSVIDQDRISRFYIFRKIFIRLAAADVISFDLLGCQCKLASLFQIYFLSALQDTGTDLRSFCVQQNSDRQLQFFSYFL